MKLISQRHQVFQEDWLETVKDPVSVTVPDETLSIQEIMEKHTRGMNVADQMMRSPINSEGADFDDPDLEKIGAEDFAEKFELYNQAKADRKAAEDKIRSMNDDYKLEQQRLEDERYDQAVERNEQRKKVRDQDEGGTPQPPRLKRGKSEAD